MRMQFPVDDGPLDPEWFQPLIDIDSKVPAHGSLCFFDPDDFMLMGRVIRHPRPAVTLYKHRYTRRYLNLDSSGQAYQYVPPAPGRSGNGQYRRHRDLSAALYGLGLWELPQLKPSLARILQYDAPIELDDDELDQDLGGQVDSDGPQEPVGAREEVRHGGLRLV